MDHPISVPIGFISTLPEHLASAQQLIYESSIHGHEIKLIRKRKPDHLRSLGTRGEVTAVTAIGLSSLLDLPLSLPDVRPWDRILLRLPGFLTSPFRINLFTSVSPS